MLTAAAAAVLFSVSPTSLALIAAIGIFVIGIVVGIIMVVSHGIRQEEQRFQEERRFLEEHGMWDSPDGPGHYIAENAPDGMRFAVRRHNGLYARALAKALSAAGLMSDLPPWS